MDRSPNVAERALLGGRHQFVKVPVDSRMARATLEHFCLVSRAPDPFPLAPNLDRLIWHPFDLSTQLAELFLNSLVAAVDVIDTIDERLANSCESGQHQPG